MPHVNIKYFARPVSEEQKRELVAAVTEVVTRTLECPEDVISIALEPIDPDAWSGKVHVPEILNRKELLIKTPDY